MPAYNKNFELGLQDLDMIETALRGQMADLSKKGLDGELSAREQAREIHELLGRLHDQKVFFRPKDAPYIGG